jgi:hypothetical protein
MTALSRAGVAETPGGIAGRDIRSEKRDNLAPADIVRAMRAQDVEK